MPLLQMCQIHRDFKHFTPAKAINFAALRKVSSIMRAKLLSIMRAVETRLTSLFKRIRRAPWQALTHRPGT